MINALKTRILDRSRYYARPLYHGGREIVTDGICAVLTATDHACDCPAHVASLLCAPPAAHARCVPLASLRDFVGPAGVAIDVACPECGCDYEATTRPYAAGPGSDEWVDILGLPIDGSRLADLLAPWSECEVVVWLEGGALYVEGNMWRVVLMSGDSARSTPKRVWRQEGGST